MKVAVTGASGLLGRAICKDFKHHQFEVHGFAKSRVGPGLSRLDLLDEPTVRATLLQLRPDAIVHAAAARAPDQVERDPAAARRLNVDASAVIAAVAGEIGAQLVYISTDYVFDGEAAPYAADAPASPVNEYGRTKLEGENVTLANCPGAAVLRVPVLYGPVETLQESAVTVLFTRLLDSSAAVSVSDRELRYPAHVDDVASICRQLLLKQRQDGAAVRGVYQWSGEERLTKYAMVQLMAARLGLSCGHVTPDREAPPAGTRRPLDSQMDTSRLLQLGIHAHRPFGEGVCECLIPFAPKQAH